GAVLDLMIHDLDILQALVRAQVSAIEAIGVSLFGTHEDLAHARLRFENGCLANLTASRANPEPARRLRGWGPEGYASVDFAARSLTVAQPAAHLRRANWDVRRLDPAALAAFRTELFSRHVETLRLDCNRGDQLTRELEHFVQCVRTGAPPRVS